MHPLRLGVLAGELLHPVFQVVFETDVHDERRKGAYLGEGFTGVSQDMDAKGRLLHFRSANMWLGFGRECFHQYLELAAFLMLVHTWALLRVAWANDV